MLDDPKKTARLLDDLKAAVPFNVAVMPWVVKHLRAQHDDLVNAGEHVVCDLSYAGDAGGIVVIART